MNYKQVIEGRLVERYGYEQKRPIWFDQDDNRIDLSEYDLVKFQGSDCKWAYFFRSREMLNAGLWTFKLLKFPSMEVVAEYKAYSINNWQDGEFNLSERNDITLETEYGAVTIPYEVWKNYVIVRKYEGLERDYIESKTQENGK